MASQGSSPKLIHYPRDIRQQGLPIHTSVPLHWFLAHWRCIWGKAQLKSRREARDGWIVTSPVKPGSSFLTIRVLGLRRES